MENVCRKFGMKGTDYILVVCLNTSLIFIKLHLKEKWKGVEMNIVEQSHPLSATHLDVSDFF